MRTNFNYNSHEATRTGSNMAGVGKFLKNAWNKEPVVTAACALGTLALILPVVSPFSKYTRMINQSVPYNYPVPVRDDGNMPDIPAHPSDPQGKNLDWLKNL